MIPSWLFTIAVAADAVVLGPPRAAVLVGTGVPNLIGGHVEIWLAEQWTVEIGAGSGLLPPSVEVVGRMRPRATCVNCAGRNSLSVGFGVSAMAFVEPRRVALLVSPEVDLRFHHRFPSGVGMAVGARVGVGPTTEFGGGADPTRIEPGVNLVLPQVGIVL